MMRRYALTAAPLLLLAACSGSEPTPEPPANADAYLDVTDEAANVAEAPTPTPTPSATPTPEETPTPVSPDEQVQADAEATGMTARVDREADQPAQDDAQPVEEKKE